jgi:D-aspartate ligase
MNGNPVEHGKLPGVVITANPGPNTLGVVRCFGRRGIPVFYVDMEKGAISRYSRYVSKRLSPQYSQQSEVALINTIMQFSPYLDRKIMIIPTGDDEVLAISKHRDKLEKVYILPVSDYEIVHKLVNKKLFYKMLAEVQFPHPTTYFPESNEELLAMGRDIPYPYIIKPAYSLSFRRAFNTKCLVISSHRELERAVNRLKLKDEEVMLQEIVPGNDYYEFYTYFDKKSLPLAACGWKKIRHYPPNFGSGSFCKSEQLPYEIGRCNELLKSLGYHGFAAPELVRDPRDDSYKLLEINARTTLQNRLAAACGVDIEYIAYLDLNGLSMENLRHPIGNVIWIDDFLDLATRLILLKRKKITIKGLFHCSIVRKVHSVMAWDDPIPQCIHMFILSFSLLLRFYRTIRGWFDGNRVKYQ